MSGTTRIVPEGGEVPAVVIDLSAELLAGAAELGAAMAEHLHDEIAELGDSGAVMLDETRASCESNLLQSLGLLRQAAPPESLIVTPQASRYVRAYIGRGLALPVLLRTYRLGHAWMWERWSEALRERIDDPTELAGALEFSSRWMFAYIDLISAALVEEFAAEQAQLARSADRRRAASVRAILAGELADEATASLQLGHELRRAQLALHIWSEGEESERLERVASEAAAALGCRSPLVVAGGVGALDVWCTCGERSTGGERSLAGFEPPDGICVALGGGVRATGIDGFCLAHRQSREAARVRQLAGTVLGQVVDHDDVELLALLTTDPERALRFTHRVLGPLASGDEAVERLRETLLAYLTCNRSATQAAKRLFVHQNTVAYRIGRVEELLGRSVRDGQPELLCALILAPLLTPTAD